MSGEQFADVGRGVTLCYETFGASSDRPLLLVMGLGSQMIFWEEDFCEALAARGFHVIRFDNRDTGRSTIMADSPPPTLITPTWSYFAGVPGEAKPFIQVTLSALADPASAPNATATSTAARLLLLTT